MYLNEERDKQEKVKVPQLNLGKLLRLSEQRDRMKSGRSSAIALDDDSDEETNRSLAESDLRSSNATLDNPFTKPVRVSRRSTGFRPRTSPSQSYSALLSSNSPKHTFSGIIVLLSVLVY